MGRFCWWLGLSLALTPAARAEDTAPLDPALVEFFEMKVRPVLAERCFGCHGPDKQKSGLRLDSAEAIRAGGDSGPAIAPGEPAASLLVDAIRQEGDLRMPPKGKLHDSEVAAIEEWIRRGAPWPKPRPDARPATVALSRPISDEDRAFWSFRPVREVRPPDVADPSWPESPIDRFTLAGLEAQGLHPAPPADKRTLIRRATFDLIGLPPTPEEVEAFVADESPGAFAKVVDRLLASPHYGERWARHWLDVARYGEDQAHSFQPRLYPQGYRYRDWVASAFNADLPYDRFVVEQVAGDLLDEPGRLDRLPALGFFALGPVYYGDPKKFDQIDDRIDTMTRGFLGLTVACARCHDHKFDPIGTADYYALAGVVASSEYEEAPLAPPEVVAAYDQAQSAIKAKDREIAGLLRAEADRLARARAGEVARYVVAAWEWNRRRATDPEVSAESLADAFGVEPGPLRRWLDALRSSRDRPHLAALADVLEARPTGDNPDAVPSEVTEAAQAFQARVLDLIDRRETLASNATGTKGGGSPTPDEADRALLKDLLGDRGLLAVAKDRVEGRMSAEAKAALAALRADLGRRKAEAPPKYPVAHAWKDGSKPKDLPVLIRGNPDTPGAVVPRRFLAILGGDAAPFAHGSGRLELARAIARPDNPLTARVMVNRIWQHHFGRGLVGTPSNFGALGERPSHPELLDSLAHRFVASGWSVKAMHRLILLSATYRQSSRFDAHAYEVDPEGRLLWRMPRRRLEVEPWRDAMLAVSGRLDRAIGGPSAKLDDPDNRRRTFYASVSRHDLAPLLRLFDFPDPNVTGPERTRTTVALQGLLVLNDRLLIDNSRALADRLAREAGGDDEARIRRAYALLFARPASEDEVRLGLAFLRAPGDGAGPSRWERYAQALLGTNEFLFVD